MKSKWWIFVFTGLTAVLLSCSKNGGDPGPAQFFSWRLDNGAEEFSDTTSLLSLFDVHTIFGKRGATSVFISTNSTNTGLYSMSNGNAGFGLNLAGAQYSSISGQIHIASNSNRRLSGTYSAVVINGTVDTISMIGQFSGIRY